ncbi:hypothetical protein [Methylorubrum extorquens]|uniref:hypothetical protein n=1 Tax=Methylorubrum extorquens TaxID=408 RepID=UPI00209F5801|nr:hypothetical protein [Methylorubrum extorquens]MCP1540130.1 hypothetical protein [Methylorubrum extorquens]
MGKPKKAERNKEILELRDSGITLKEIGLRYGLGKQRVLDIVRSTRAELYPEPRPLTWHADLPEKLEQAVRACLPRFRLDDFPAAEVARLVAQHDEDWWVRSFIALPGRHGVARLRQLKQWTELYGHPIKPSKKSRTRLWLYPPNPTRRRKPPIEG